MGILNATPDSFSDGGRYAQLDAALRRAEEMAKEGACIIDVGGESTRPGATPVTEAVELGRVVPIIEAIAEKLDVAISIDTSKPAVMTAALDAGACIINDVRALRVPGARARAAESGAGVCLMHMQGEPATMQQRPLYDDPVRDVTEFLRSQMRACHESGIGIGRIAVDPGIGFGKTLEHSLTLLRELPHVAQLQVPVVVGVSRKSVVGRILGKQVHERLYGGLGLASLAVSRGANIIRTHDVIATREAILCVGAALETKGA